MRIAPTAFAAFGCKITLARCGEIKEQLVALGIENLRPDRNPDNRVLTVLSKSVRALAMPAAFGLMLGVVAKVQQRVESLGRLHPDAAADTAVAARRTASRNEFFAAKCRHAIATVAGFYPYFYAVQKHKLGLIVVLRGYDGNLVDISWCGCQRLAARSFL